MTELINFNDPVAITGGDTPAKESNKTDVISFSEANANAGKYFPAKSEATVNVPVPAEFDIDLTLLRGLEPAMSTEEQARLTALLVSGNPGDLAAAAKVFYDLGVMLKAGVASPANRSEYQALQLQESFVSIPQPKRNRAGYNDREQRVVEEKKISDVDKAERSHALPLPVRMPRYEVLSAFDACEESKKKKPLTFLDDPWDGTLGSAFTKLAVHRDNNAKGLRKLLPSKKPKGSHVDHDIQFSPGFDAIVDRLPGGYSSRLIEGLDGDTQSRVLIATVAQEAAKLGLQRGDVVTHVNGEEFVGNAKDLNELITNHYEHGGENKLEIVVNAELCIAQALKLRATN